eukprot:TRINITY_DN19676_c0_g1_i1.p1 TRINITY_DN19676_c0_g1~~TRINITY_DN19676_c0_g1_i1.p1  ORF type:complete len:195 (+),score=25.19 TRINITY_DN19676_c0_g1_i1:180-764(+)
MVHIDEGEETERIFKFDFIFDGSCLFAQIFDFFFLPGIQKALRLSVDATFLLYEKDMLSQTLALLTSNKNLIDETLTVFETYISGLGRPTNHRAKIAVSATTQSAIFDVLEGSFWEEIYLEDQFNVYGTRPINTGDWVTMFGNLKGRLEQKEHLIVSLLLSYDLSKYGNVPKRCFSRVNFVLLKGDSSIDLGQL